MYPIYINVYCIERVMHAAWTLSCKSYKAAAAIAQRPNGAEFAVFFVEITGLCTGPGWFVFCSVECMVGVDHLCEP